MILFMLMLIEEIRYLIFPSWFYCFSFPQSLGTSHALYFGEPFRNVFSFSAPGDIGKKNSFNAETNYHAKQGVAVLKDLLLGFPSMTFPICIGPFFNLDHAQNEKNDGKNTKFMYLRPHWD